jgi:hypothetical protein
MDADDIASQDRFKKQLAFLEADGCDVCGSEHWNLNQLTGVLRPSKDRHTDADLRALLAVYCAFLVVLKVQSDSETCLGIYWIRIRELCSKSALSDTRTKNDGLLKLTSTMSSR